MNIFVFCFIVESFVIVWVLLTVAKMYFKSLDAKLEYLKEQINSLKRENMQKKSNYYVR